jgi:hypothetical protein
LEIDRFNTVASFPWCTLGVPFAAVALLRCPPVTVGGGLGGVATAGAIA